MLEEPKIKKVDKRDKQLPQNFEQLIEMYDVEKIWPYVLKMVQVINKDIPEDLNKITENYEEDIKKIIEQYGLEEVSNFFKSASKLMDFNASCKGMAIGKVSEKDALEIGIPVDLGDDIINNPTWNTYIMSNVDYNDITKSGTYYMGTGCTNAPEGASYVRLFVSGYNSQGDILQIAGTVTSSRLFIRTSANKVWGSWKALPNVEYLGTGKNLNNITNVGQYGIYGTNTNGPTTSIAVLEVIKYSVDWILQRVTTIEANPKIYERCYYSGNTWGAWVQSVNAGVSVSGTFNRGSWNAPTKGLITQVTDNSSAQHSVIVGLKSDGATRLYGMDLLDNDTLPQMRFYAGNGYLNVDSSGATECNGLIKSTKNGNTVTIGSQNSSCCHIYNSADIPFYFNRDIYVNGYRCLTSSDLTAGVSSIKVTDYYVTNSGIVAIASSTDGNTYFGSGSSYSGKTTNVRGNTVRLYAHSGGGVYLGSSGSTAVTSDEKLKDIYEIDDKYIEFFKNLKPITYIYKDRGHRNHMGFGARQVEEALTKAGLTTEQFAGVLKDTDVTISADEMGTEEDVHFDELYSLRYEEFIALNTYMVQKQVKQLEEQNNLIADLKARIEILEKQAGIC